MKKFINVLAVLLALVMCLGIVVACSDGEDGKETSGTTTAASTTTTPKATTTTTPTQATTTTHNPEDDCNFDATVDVPADGVIKSAAELQAVLINGASDANYTVQAETLDMAGLGWVGLKNYSGVFDFGGCTVKNALFPMFTSVLGGTVKDLVLAESTQVYTNDEAKADKDLIPLGDTATTHCQVYGGVIRYMNNGTISNVTVESTVNITAAIWLDESYIGGIVAYAKGTNLHFENCTFKGTVISDSGYIKLGGVAGTIEGTASSALNADDPTQSDVIAINCANYGTVKNTAYGNESRVGGVTGALISGAAYKCANYGEVYSTDKGQCAGVIGYVGGDITYMYCLNAGTVLGGNGYVGGVAAYSNGSSGRNFIGCVNVGTVGQAENLTTARIGGINGWCRNCDNYTNCYNLKSGQESWTYGNSAVIDPADASTYGNAVVTDCANLDTVEAVLAAIEANHPDIFVLNGTSLKLAD